MRCRACVSQIRRIAIKQRAVEYRGGSCEHCGWNRNNAALHFHHVNPSEKEFNIGKSNGWSWDKIVIELDKCIMLCANCHAIEHAVRYKKQAIIDAAENYVLSWKTVKGTGKKHTPIKEYIPWNKGKELTHLRKCVRPSKDELEKMLWSIPTTKIAEKYHVSDSAINKWAKLYGIAKPPRGYWTKFQHYTPQ